VDNSFENISTTPVWPPPLFLSFSRMREHGGNSTFVGFNRIEVLFSSFVVTTRGRGEFLRKYQHNARLAAPSLLVILAHAGTYTVEIALLLVSTILRYYFRHLW
jgi:hypothetical protein